MDKVKIGQITAPFGIKGEVRVFSYMDEITRFSHIKNIYLGESLNMHYGVEKVRYDKGMALIKFKEVLDRNTSETLRGLNLYLSRDEYKLDDDSYLIDDLIGCKVISEDGTYLGNLLTVIQNSSQDVYEIGKENKKSFLVPAVKEFIKDVNLDDNVITIHVIEGLINEI